jgi:hypothetical protein
MRQPQTALRFHFQTIRPANFANSANLHVICMSFAAVCVESFPKRKQLRLCGVVLWWLSELQTPYQPSRPEGAIFMPGFLYAGSPLSVRLGAVLIAV